MIVDSSALIAIILREPGCDALIAALAGAKRPGIGAPSLAECGIVLTARLGPPGRSLLARTVAEAGLAPIAFGEEHWPVAIDAFDRYGKGRHRAQLNFGDCMTYAVARLAGEELLATGEDFAHTDLALVA